MKNPFENGHIKNYLLLYASVVVIMILFFIASTLFHDIQEVEPKVFLVEKKDENATTTLRVNQKTEVDKNTTNRFKLLDKAY